MFNGIMMILMESESDVYGEPNHFMEISWAIMTNNKIFGCD